MEESHCLPDHEPQTLGPAADVGWRSALPEVFPGRALVFWIIEPLLRELGRSKRVARIQGAFSDVFVWFMAKDVVRGEEGQCILSAGRKRVTQGPADERVL